LVVFTPNKDKWDQARKRQAESRQESSKEVTVPTGKKREQGVDIMNLGLAGVRYLNITAKILSKQQKRRVVA